MAGLSSVALAVGPRPAAAEEIETLTIGGAIELAQRQARDVVKARADVLIAEARQTRAFGAIQPRVDLTIRGGGTHRQQPIIESILYEECETLPEICPEVTSTALGPLDERVHVKGLRDQFVVDNIFLPSFLFTLTVRQLIYDGGRWWAEIARAGALERLRRAALRQTLNNVRVNVVRRFFGLERARRTLATFERRVQLGQEQLERARVLAASLQGSAGDVASAERNLAEDRLALARREFAESQARRALNLALARPADLAIQIALPDRIQTASVALQGLSIPTKEQAFAAADKNRPELAFWRANLEQLERVVDVRRAGLFPRVTVQGRYTRASRKPERVFSPLDENFFAGVDVTLQWNLFEGRRTLAAISEAELNLSKATADFQEVERNIYSQVETQRENLALQLQVYTLAAGAVAFAHQAVSARREQYERGTTTVLSLRDAELRYTQARLNAINAVFDVEIAREELRRAVGADLLGSD